jgi:hypothetical protein
MVGGIVYTDCLSVESPPCHSFYEPAETVLFYGFVIPEERLNNTIASLYRELVDSRPDPVTNGLATLYISEALRDFCPDAAFRAVRCSREQPTRTMMCIGSNLQPFSLVADMVAPITDKLGMHLTDAKWCFSNRRKSQFYEYEFDGEESTDDELTEESTDEPLTDQDEELADVASISCAEEWTDQVSDGSK